MIDPPAADDSTAGLARSGALSGRRLELLHRVARYLTELDDESLPEGIDPSLAQDHATPADLATLAAALTQTAREVQLQGRAVKKLSELLERAQAETAGRVGIELDELLDLYDSLSRCEAAARASGTRLPRFTRWFGGSELLDGVLTGVRMIRDRVAVLLARVNVTPIESDGLRFDPRCMRAVGVARPSAQHPAGQVTETVRRGFSRGEQVLRPAEVRVAGAAAAVESTT